MLRLAESLVYDQDSATSSQVTKMAEQYVTSVKSLSSADLEQRKPEITEVLRAFRYLAKWNIVSGSFGPLAGLGGIEKAQGWDKPKK